MFSRWLLVLSLAVSLLVVSAPCETFPVTSQQFAFCTSLHRDNLYCVLPTFGVSPGPFAKSGPE
jgi:hypothetical protein